MSAGPSNIPANITAITAPPLLGTLFNWGLYGVLSVQVYIYYLNFPDDKLSIKCLVYVTYLLEVVQTALSTADLYYWFASGYGNMNRLGLVYISPWDTPFLCGIIAAIVQCFFAYRIWKLERRRWISVLIISTSMIQTGGAIGSAIIGQIHTNFAQSHANEILPSIWLLGDTVCDILIAGSMLYIFYKSKKQEFPFANNTLARLVRLIVETNTLTASIALLAFVLYIAAPGNNFMICPTLIMGKLYSNTLLVTFNNRISLRMVVSDMAPSTLKARGQNSSVQGPVDDMFRNTYHLSPERFRNNVKPKDIENIEIEVFKDINVYGKQDSHIPVTRCQHKQDCYGCVPASESTFPQSDKGYV